MYLETLCLEQRLMRIKQRASAGCAAPSRAEPPMNAVTVKDSEPPESSPAAPEAELPTEGASTGNALKECRRRSARVAASGDVGVRRIGGFNFQAELQDVSTGGCRVELMDPYEAGDFVVARFPQLEPFGARVRWAAGTTGGLEFLSAMHPTVFDMLLTRLSAER